MKQKNSILILFLFLITISAWSQEFKKLSLGFEVGSGIVVGEMTDNWFVRQDIGSDLYDYNYSSSSLSKDMSISYLGIKTEYSLAKNKIGILSGIRLTRINSYLDKYTSSGTGYFFLRNSEEGTNTEFFKVKKINEDIDYLGIPIELRYSPFQYKYFCFYFKVGTQINFKLHSKTDIQFLNENMEAYQNKIINSIDFTPNSIFASVYSSVGVKIGKENNVNYNFELVLPSKLLTSNNSSVVVPASYTGFQFSVLFPLKQKKQ